MSDRLKNNAGKYAGKLFRKKI